MICTPDVNVPSHILIGLLGGSKETHQLVMREYGFNQWWWKPDTLTSNWRMDDILKYRTSNLVSDKWGQQ